MFTIKEVLVEQARAEEKMRQAEYNRLASQFRKESRFSQFRRSALTRLGTLLMAVGRKLQARQNREQMSINREIWIHTH